MRNAEWHLTNENSKIGIRSIVIYMDILTDSCVEMSPDWPDPETAVIVYTESLQEMGAKPISPETGERMV
tara:strand:+ start:1081 stop:1290 length:210 start_codon:yes stop_codon:yes gene_type:complete